MKNPNAKRNRWQHATMSGVFIIRFFLAFHGMEQHIIAAIRTTQAMTRLIFYTPSYRFKQVTSMPPAEEYAYSDRLLCRIHFAAPIPGRNDTFNRI